MSCAQAVSARDELEGTGQIAQLNRTVGADGKERPRQVERKAPEPELPLASAVAVGKATAAQVLARVEPALTREVAGMKGGRGNKAIDNVNSFKTKGGNQADYLAARIKRDHPQIAAGIAAGEYPSIRAAAIAAGIVKVPSALEAAKRAALRLSDAERAELQEWLRWLGSL